MERVKQLEKELEKGAASSARANAEVEEINGVKTVIAKVNAANAGALRGLADQFRQKVASGMVVLAAVINDKVSLIVSVTPDLTGRFNAGDIVKKLSAVVGGTGGGRADMAQGGGSEVSKIDELIAKAKGIL
jgi:alanyl-tRNA synthetase